ncbi:YggS family pyridoxal phosphate-dependent enzyme [Roseimaritima ulvae]|uniref:Pyridoxal phosphate homeostasis protein n=1 Tax=Roseimaritima ulvae TaxID=980254 RepID=A0A5B9QVI1_9BACT|nr:YggS family pyridoxal phosphate-dependent enzyme [Roseimaritima ulvae]QEG41385.1 Pyridoxal phosphate homeostasis protein [Roseimaritima ulvae]
MITFHQPLPPADLATVRDNWLRLVEDVAKAAADAGRTAADVQIVGVTKYVDPPTAACLVAAGCHHLGENRPQKLWEKAQWMQQQSSDPDRIRWHMIGHLQRNKIRRTVPLLHLLHSVDSPRLATALSEVVSDSREADAAPLDVLLEVNVTGDESKTGMLPDQARQTLESLLAQPAIRVQGLMGMAGIAADPAECRRQFATIRQLRDDWQSEYSMVLPQLSMGMSGDFAEAIAEGATIIRVGTRLFAGL